ncbi:adenosylcobalamin-dependent ribonucleoside-diphosphate reductase [Nanoarchaeota archaeon]
MKLTNNAKIILRERYLRKNKKGKVVETPSQLFRRVSRDIAKADSKYPKQRKNIKKTENKFFKIMSSLDFLPNSPTLMNAGTKNEQLAACFVLPIEDSLNSIFTTLHKTAIIHKSGGGTGFDFSKLRSRNDYILETGGTSSGPVSFIRVFDSATEQVKQGGKRRGANMAILRIDHPDIEEFIIAKQKYPINNFNFSVAITDNFMQAYKKRKSFHLVNPLTKKKTKKDPRKLFDLLCKSAMLTGDPGVIFIDTINKHHPLKEKITAVNPCGEQPLLPYEACNLGSINLSNHYKNGDVDWNKLRTTIYDAVHFLDNVIDRSDYKYKEIEEMTKKNRKIGLGIMGFADLLFKLKIPYNSDEAVEFASLIMEFIRYESEQASHELAILRGPFPNFKKSKLKVKLRNATLNTIAPTGTISMIAGCSSGIEPVFALAFTHDVLNHKKLSEVNFPLMDYLKQKKLNLKSILNKIKKKGTLKGLKEIKDRNVFVTSMEVEPKYHLLIQATFQVYIDNAVSKTVNLKSSATINDVKKIFLNAYKLGCKGITVYRYGSKEQQVLTFGCEECQ